jgi:DNA-binding NarL/FixJ family response regulator
MSIRVVLADDHAIVRDGLRRILQETGDIEVVGEAGDGQEAVALAERLLPHVMLMDISMPALNGMQATRSIKARSPRVAVVFLSMHESEQYFLEALRCGAAGYVPKSAPASDVVDAVRAAAAGQVYLHPSVARFLLHAFLVSGTPSEPGGQAYAGLTPRERETLGLVAAGMTNQEIAVQLDLSPNTVHRHRTNLMHKLGLHDRLEVLRYCVQWGLTS